MCRLVQPRLTEFKQFCNSMGTNHLFNLVYHPQSNGQAEQVVATFKRARHKLQGEENLAYSLT